MARVNAGSRSSALWSSEKSASFHGARPETTPAVAGLASSSATKAASVSSAATERRRYICPGGGGTPRSEGKGNGGGVKGARFDFEFSRITRLERRVCPARPPGGEGIYAQEGGARPDLREGNGGGVKGALCASG